MAKRALACQSGILAAEGELDQRHDLLPAGVTQGLEGIAADEHCIFAVGLVEQGVFHLMVESGRDFLQLAEFHVSSRAPWQPRHGSPHPHRP